MNRELYEQATYPGINRASSAMLLRSLADVGREQALAALTAALVRPEALALAEALAEPLAEAQEAAAEPLAAVDAARKALTKEKQGVISRVAAFYNAARRRDEGDRERPPEQDTPAVQELTASLAVAEQAAMPFKQRADYHLEQVEGLRRAPAPDPGTLAALAAVLIGGHRDAD